MECNTHLDGKHGPDTNNDPRAPPVDDDLFNFELVYIQASDNIPQGILSIYRLTDYLNHCLGREYQVYSDQRVANGGRITVPR